MLWWFKSALTIFILISSGNALVNDAISLSLLKIMSKYFSFHAKLVFDFWFKPYQNWCSSDDNDYPQISNNFAWNFTANKFCKYSHPSAWFMRLILYNLCSKWSFNIEIEMIDMYFAKRLHLLNWKSEIDEC